MDERLSTPRFARWGPAEKTTSGTGTAVATHTTCAESPDTLPTDDQSSTDLLESNCTLLNLPTDTGTTTTTYQPKSAPAAIPEPSTLIIISTVAPETSADSERTGTAKETLILVSEVTPEPAETKTVQHAVETTIESQAKPLADARMVGLIACGAVLILLLNMALVFFCLRRRKLRAARLRQMLASEASASHSSLQPFNRNSSYPPSLSDAGSESPPSYAAERWVSLGPSVLEVIRIEPFLLPSLSRASESQSAISGLSPASKGTPVHGR